MKVVSRISYLVTRIVFFCQLAAFAPSVFAHEVRPAYLELHQTGAENYDILWKVPGREKICAWDFMCDCRRAAQT